MVVEIVLYEDVYLDEEFLKKGNDGGNNKNILNNFVMYSDSYEVGNHISPAYTRRILREDTMFVKLGAYENSWQLFAVSCNRTNYNLVVGVCLLLVI